jgi:hypothetical protein
MITLRQECMTCQRAFDRNDVQELNRRATLEMEMQAQACVLVLKGEANPKQTQSSFTKLGTLGTLGTTWSRSMERDIDGALLLEVANLRVVRNTNSGLVIK